MAHEAYGGVEKIKIAMITTWGERCGIASYSYNLAPAIAAQGHEVYIVRVPFHGFKPYEVLYNVVENIPKHVDLIHCQHEYGIYQSHESNFFQALKLLRKPIVTTMHAIGNTQIDEHISSNSDRIITHNEYCRSRLEYPSTVIPHGCAVTPAADPATSKKRYNIPPEAPIIGYLGYISPYKGLEILIEAAKHMQGVALAIAGGSHSAQDTNYIMQLKERTLRDLKGRCVWLNYIPEQDLKYAYATMDLLVYPSRYATESGALLTAMGYGRVVLASRLPPFVEKEKLGALATYGNPKELEEAIKILLANAEQRAAIREHALAYCEENSWGNVAKMHVDLYNEMLRG